MMNEIQDDLSLPRQFTEGNYKLKALYFCPRINFPCEPFR